MVKYNKKMQERISININDYKTYSDLIEIELRPVANKYGDFINFKDKDEKYYHMYYNKNKEETKRKHIIEGEEIKIIKIIIDCQVTSFERLFYKCKCIESIYFKKFCRNNITYMSYMFRECISLKELSLNNFNTNNVTDMSGMFAGCSDELILQIKSQFKNFKKEAF